MFWCGWPGISKVPKVPTLQYCVEKEVRDTLSILHEHKYQNFVEADTFNYLQQQVCNISAISQEKREP